MMRMAYFSTLILPLVDCAGLCSGRFNRGVRRGAHNSVKFGFGGHHGNVQFGDHRNLYRPTMRRPMGTYQGTTSSKFAILNADSIWRSRGKR